MALALPNQVCWALPHALDSSSSKLLDSSMDIRSCFIPLSFHTAWSFLENTSTSRPLHNSADLSIHLSNDQEKNITCQGMCETLRHCTEQDFVLPSHIQQIISFPFSVKPGPDCTSLVDLGPPLPLFRECAVFITVSLIILYWQLSKIGTLFSSHSMISGWLCFINICKGGAGRQDILLNHRNLMY